MENENLSPQDSPEPGKQANSEFSELDAYKEIRYQAGESVSPGKPESFPELDSTGQAGAGNETRKLDTAEGDVEIEAAQAETTLVISQAASSAVESEDTQPLTLGQEEGLKVGGVEGDQVAKVPEDDTQPIWYAELAEFKEGVTKPEPKPSQPAKFEGTRGLYAEHWAKTGENPVLAHLQDDIPTIPPSPQVPVPTAKQAEELPRMVREIDPQATVLSQAAFTPSPKPGSTQPVRVGRKARTPAAPKPRAAQDTRVFTPEKKTSGRNMNPWLLIMLLFFSVIILGMVIGVVGYLRIAATLPDVDELRQYASQFETTRILDRNGNILYEIVDPNAGRRTYVPLERISPYMIAATLATEDKEYFNHPGFDVVALGRALWTNYTSGEIVSGASTITQQLARMLLLSDERFEQSYDRKAREIILAAEITRRYSKEDVLELYLNEIFYSNRSYGVEAAANTYFKSTAADLELWQSAFLAGLPQSPAVYDIYNNRDVTLARNKTVLVLMYELSRDKNCIFVGEAHDKVCVDAQKTLEAADTLDAYDFPQDELAMRFPHWVVYIQSLLETQFDAQTIYRSGFTVYTSLDPDLQREAQAAVRDQVGQMAANNATNGALVAIDPDTGEILAMVGSADFYNEAISGQVNMAVTQTRQPGSSIKPITYLAAFEKDWTPGTLLWDVPSAFPPSGREDDLRPAYEPVNYDGRFHGPITLRSALANSYNIPAVKALAYVGIYDDPQTPEKDGFIGMAEKLGITSLTRDDYGLSLTLGGGEVSLLEMTGAFSVLAHEGKRIAPVAITRVVDFTGKEIYAYSPPEGDQVIRKAHAYLMNSILSDSQARRPAFGAGNVLELPFAAAVKTGTTNDFRDNWTIGYTPDLVVGVWVGNADYSPMVNTSGVSGAGPIWARVMQSGINLLKGGKASSFVRPNDVIDRNVCALSGAEASEWCPQERNELFAADQPPRPKSEDLWVRVKIDSWTELAASPACTDFIKDKIVINVKDKFAIRWLKETEAGREWVQDKGFSDPLIILPERECRMDDSRPIIDLVNLGGPITENPFTLRGVIDASSNFKEYRIEWGEGDDPNDWNVLVDWENTPARSVEDLYTWNMDEIEAKVITLRVTLRSTKDTKAEKKYVLVLALPTPTPTMTPTVTATPTATLEPTLTPTPTATAVPSATATPVPPEPTLPVATATP